MEFPRLGRKCTLVLIVPVPLRRQSIGQYQENEPTEADWSTVLKKVRIIAPQHTVRHNLRWIDAVARTRPDQWHNHSGEAVREGGLVSRE